MHVQPTCDVRGCCGSVQKNLESQCEHVIAATDYNLVMSDYTKMGILYCWVFIQSRLTPSLHVSTAAIILWYTSCLTKVYLIILNIFFTVVHILLISGLILLSCYVIKAKDESNRSRRNRQAANEQLRLDCGPKFRLCWKQ